MGDIVYGPGQNKACSMKENYKKKKKCYSISWSSLYHHTIMLVWCLKLFEVISKFWKEG